MTMRALSPWWGVGWGHAEVCRAAAPDAGMPRVPLDARHTSSAQLGLMLKPAYGSNPTGQLTLGAPGRAYRTQVIPMHSTAKAAPIQ